MRACGTLFVSGMPVRVTEDPTLAQDGVFGVTYYDGPDIALRSCTPSTPRVNRALIHEMLHVVDDMGRLGLTHDQIRVIAAALDSTFRDPRNRSFLSSHFQWRT